MNINHLMCSSFNLSSVSAILWNTNLPSFDILHTLLPIGTESRLFVEELMNSCLAMRDIMGDETRDRSRMLSQN